MLLNNEIKITITNNGKENNMELTLDSKDKFSDIATCLEMAKESLTEVLGKYLKNKGGVTESELEDILKTITLEEIYAN
jgi:hypothetical protein